MLKKLFNSLSYTRIIALSFFGVILMGAILLFLPISSKSREFTPFLDAFFTATSATCVTGLVVYDTFTHWSLFGQIVILIMIQIGGIGLMTIISTFFLFKKKKIGLQERILLMQSAGNTRLSGVVRLIKNIIYGTIFFETIGAVLLSFSFCPKMGVKGIYYAVFHSISAFCNAGFDIMGAYGKFSSFTSASYQNDVIVNLTLIMLIIVGGIGFLVWDDILKNRFNFSKYMLHTKIILLITAFLLVSGSIGFYIFEYNASLAGFSPAEKILPAVFMSVTSRTAGFNTIDISALSQSGCLLCSVLMFIGGGSGSTSGGIKVGTFAVIAATAVSMSRGDSEVTLFKKRLEDGLVKQAAVIMLIYITGVLIASMIICYTENTALTDSIFETVSAAATVGLSRGITPMLGTLSRIILIIIMFGGRIGGLSLVLVFGEKKKTAYTKRPSEKILIG